MLFKRYFTSIFKTFIKMLLISVALTSPVNAATCGDNKVQLQVLGSGGPELQTKRAGSSYIVWVNGKARVLIDAGGGSALRFGESGASVTDLSAVLFTHLHIDHTSDFAALIKSSYFENRTAPLPVFGPSGNSLFPSTTTFVAGLFGESGIYRYLHDFVSSAENNDSSYRIAAKNIEAIKGVERVYQDALLTIDAVTVLHGAVPALAWRIKVQDKSLVFTGDTSAFIENNIGNIAPITHHADILVAHNAVPEGATGAARHLHMPPSEIGRIAQAAQVKQLILSHRMQRTLGKEPQTLAAITQHYTGKISFANDLECFSPE